MKRPDLFFTALVVPLDALAIISAAFAAFFLRLSPLVTEIRPVVFDLTPETYSRVMSLVVLLWIFVFALSGLYRFSERRLMEELKMVFLSSASTIAVVFALLFFSLSAFESRFIVLAGWGLAVVFLWIERILVRGLRHSLLLLGIGLRRVVLIGHSDATDILENTFAKRLRFGTKVVGIFQVFDRKTEEHVRHMARRHQIEELIFTDTEADRDILAHLKTFTDVEHLRLRYSADLFTVGSLRMEAATVAGIPLMTIKKTTLDGWGAIYKRAFDIVGSSSMILLTFPIMIAESIAIKIDSRGPVFFSRDDDGKKITRVGEGGVPFFYFKFRSMYDKVHRLRYTELANLDTRKGPLVKIKNDPRVTRVGHFIRASSLDELSELFLVLRGKMSLVGPRPHLPEEVEKYEDRHRKVLTVKPGITGLSQISGRADLDFEDEVRLDTFYIENWSLWLDLVILLKTPWIVLFRKGAY